MSSDSDDDSFHPMGADWEEEMRARLEETDYDADLGMEMAKDAMRVTAGDLSEAEFHERYHDEVMDEFGMDERPSIEAFEDAEADADDADEEGLFERVKGFAGDTEQSRRSTMKQMGAGAAALGFGKMASGEDGGTQERHADGPGTNPGHGVEEGETQFGMVIDLERCDGCLSCVSGCIEENGTSSGANWMYVLTYEDHETHEDNFLVRPCQHCSNAPCQKVCPVTARHKRDYDGLVLTDYEICIGCRYCQVACPYGVNYFQWGEPDMPDEEIMQTEMSAKELRQLSQEERDQELTEASDHKYDGRGRWVDSRPPKGVMGKCTFCPTRQDGHSDRPRGTTACQDACDTAGMSAIHFGDLNDPESRPNRYLEARSEHREENNPPVVEDPPTDEEFWETVTQDGDLSAFRLLEDLGTEPNVVYLGNEPGPHAEQKEGPVSYEAIGAVDDRKEWTDLGAQANRERGIWGDD